MRALIYRRTSTEICPYGGCVEPTRRQVWTCMCVHEHITILTGCYDHLEQWWLAVYCKVCFEVDGRSEKLHVADRADGFA